MQICIRYISDLELLNSLKIVFYFSIIVLLIFPICFFLSIIFMPSFFLLFTILCLCLCKAHRTALPINASNSYRSWSLAQISAASASAWINGYTLSVQHTVHPTFNNFGKKNVCVNVYWSAKFITHVDLIQSIGLHDWITTRQQMFEMINNYQLTW